MTLFRSGNMRLRLPVPGSGRFHLSARTGPNRLLLSLPDGWAGPARQNGKGMVRGMRWLARQKLMVFDLARAIAQPRATQSAGQLTIEFAPGTPAAFAAFAGEDKTIAASGAPTGGPRSLPLVVLDPGHGGKDPGTIGKTGTYEKRITLAAGLELKRQLEAGGRCRVAMTRGRDFFVPLDGRVDFARKRQAALFISLHADSAPGARGASVYTLNDRASDALSAALARRENDADRKGGLNIPEASPEVQRILISLVRQETRQGSARLASLAVNSLGQSVRLLPNTHREAAFAVLKAPDIPSMLVEMGFLSDATDEALLKQPGHRAKVCTALTQAVHNWLARQEAGVGATG
ncbi:N-acetylmuramoyl-L-alanine amidase [Acetobacteraceae bacterium H6797]|nr:N-acetylmuramoyl-L-alanine amidase [Acetobacteraceae bacterium H6797]